VLDTNCFIDAPCNAEFRATFNACCAQASPGLHLSSVVAAERDVFEPYRRLVTPSAQSWEILGTTLATMATGDGLILAEVPRRLIFDILVAHSCRETGIILVTAKIRDMTRLAKIFAFDFVAPFPKLL
jgi:hypothetical protein